MNGTAAPPPTPEDFILISSDEGKIWNLLAHTDMLTNAYYYYYYKRNFMIKYTVLSHNDFLRQCMCYPQYPV